jgi:hypothetical protein
MLALCLPLGAGNGVGESMNKRATWMGALAIVFVATAATAHPVDYINLKTIGDHVVICQSPPSTVNPFPFGFGGVCYEAGHIVTPGPGTVVTFTVTDNLKAPVSALYRNVVDIPFCGVVSVTDGIDFDSSVDTIIFVDGIIFGNPVLSPCGPLLPWTAGWIGTVNHTP